jgi:Ca-activated chloride channel family protein
MTRRIAALVLGLSCVPSPLLSQGPTFSTKVEAVRVDVLVTEAGRPVRDLRPRDFEVLDDGVPQQVDLATFEQIPLNVVLALDLSDSVAGERLSHLRTASRALLAALRPDDQAALVSFSHTITVGSSLTRDRTVVERALERDFAAGETSVIDATFAAMMLGESDVGRALLIVFSDGLDTASWLSEAAVLDTAKRSDVVVYAVSIDAPRRRTFLTDITELTGGSLFDVEATANLTTVFLGILEEFRNRYLISYEPREVAPDGWHRLEVRVKGRTVKIKARTGYLAGS